jgi:lysophospholipase L1-like esterase
VLIIVVYLFWFSKPAQADITGWLASGSPVLTKDQDLAPGQLPPYRINGNQDCTQHDFTIKLVPKTILSSCATEASFGLADSNGLVQFNNSSLSGQLSKFSSSGFAPGFIVVPKQNTLINYTFAGLNGLFLQFTHNAKQLLTRSTNVLSAPVFTYTLSQPPDRGLRDMASNLLPAQTDSLSFSDDGDWMIVDSPPRAIIRVNTQTLQVLPFAPTFVYGNGLNPGLQTAISNDGRYAVVSSSFGSFRIYDLSTCGPVPDTVNSPVSCESRDLQTVLSQQISGSNIKANNIRFTSGDTLSFYVSYTSPSGTNKITKYWLSTPGSTVVRSSYLALGDSFSSGEGAYNYVDGTDITSNRCHLATSSYSYLIASQLNLNGFHSVACSGALTKDAYDVYSQNDYNKNHSQAQQKQTINFDPEIYQNFLPGYRIQNNFVKLNQPKVVTISMGGNDVGFAGLVAKCLGPGTCYNTYEERLALVHEINSKFDGLTKMYSDIRSGMPSDGRLYIVGYPQLVFPGGNCAINVHLNSEELVFAQQLVQYLDSVVHRAADYVGVRYVDVENSLYGHRHCEVDSNQVAVNGLSKGHTLPTFLNGPLGKETFHPNPLGHSLMAAKIRELTNDLNQPMPTPNLTAIIPAAEAGLAILNKPHSGETVRSTIHDETILPDTVGKGVSVTLFVSGETNGLKPGGNFNLSMHSDPISLGVAQTDIAGNIITPIIIPDSIQPGFHDIHIQGLSMADEPIDITKTIFVYANESDIDGNGIVDSTEMCVGTISSGIDIDKDGVDDACDGTISLPPISPKTLTLHIRQIKVSASF